jgi:two-component system alkaline phosphatase synthesis response regulator PhoP
MKNILLVEDDPEIVNLLRDNFIKHNYQVTATRNGRDGAEKACKNNFDLIILDIMLPDTDGMAVCRSIRDKKVATPILMLTARSEEIDKVLALELGADDYVTKPFGIRELIARVNALIRRVEQLPQNNAGPSGEIRFKNLLIDKDLKKACLNGERIDLSPKEFDLLLLLAAHPGKTYSRQELLEKVWGYSFSGYEHTVTTHINRLRLKIEANVHKPEYILTSWGSGYRFAE